MLYKFDSKFKFNFETLKIECSCKKIDLRMNTVENNVAHGPLICLFF